LRTFLNASSLHIGSESLLFSTTYKAINNFICITWNCTKGELISQREKNPNWKLGNSSLKKYEFTLVIKRTTLMKMHYRYKIVLHKHFMRTRDNALPCM
jgi:hypothetical protein